MNPRSRAVILGAELLLVVAAIFVPVAAVQASGTPLPKCVIGHVRTTLGGFDDWGKTLLDWTYALPKPYEPPDLVSVAEAGLADGPRVRALVIDDLSAMVTAAAGAGAPLEANSAYRSYGLQASSFKAYAKQVGWAKAIHYGARPGHSEHQLGTTIDFRAAGNPAPPWAVRDWGRTPQGAWLRHNAWTYGFVMSYPKGKASLVCYNYEPWHFRFVGKPEAAAIHDSKVTLRSYLWNTYGPGAGA